MDAPASAGQSSSFRKPAGGSFKEAVDRDLDKKQPAR